MFFFLGDKCNGSIIFDFRGQHDVLKVKFKFIRLSKTALRAERRTFMTHRANINTFLNTLHLVYRVMPLSSSLVNRVCYDCIITKVETMIRVI